MPSGKIISFENGEVSPSLRFRTTLAAFATGLSKLFNKTVRKSGGASNRSGFQYIAETSNQTDLKLHGKMRLVGATLPSEQDQSAENEKPVLFIMHDEDAVEVVGDGLTSSIGTMSGIIPNGGTPGPKDLKSIKVSQIKSRIIFSNGKEHWAFNRNVNDLEFKRTLGPLPIFPGVLNTRTSQPAFTSNMTLADDRPVMYFVTQVKRNGEEVPYGIFDGYVSGTPGNPINPRSFGDYYSSMRITFSLSSDAEIKHYNFYRAGRPVGSPTPSFWGLVARVTPPDADGDVQIQDYLEQQDVTSPPPNRSYLYGEFTKTSLDMPLSVLGIDTADLYRELVSARLVGHYQQRRIVVVNSATSKLDEGSVVVSKVGAPDQLDTQDIFTDIGAFDFKIPVGVKSRIVGMMEMERLILLTTDAVVVVRGGEQGLLTPTSVNPLVVSYVGCSENVAPVYAGLYGFYMSKNEDKLMRIVFSVDGNLTVDEVSLLSDHLLEGSKVKEMVLTQGKEDVLWLLKYDGTLVSITIHQGGQVTGWARHGTEGFVESITSVNQKRHFPIDTVESNQTYDSLFCLVVRDVDGVQKRLLERLSYRSDTDVKQYDYVDSSVNFGARLILDLENNRYINFNSDTLENHVQKISNNEDVTNSYRMNIGDGLAIGTDAVWAEGEEIEVNSLDAGIFVDPTIDLVVLDFFYEEDGVEKSLRWTQTGLTSANVAPGVFNGDVPTALRDLETVGATDRALQQTRVVRVKKTITGLTHLANKEVSVFADGRVISSPLNPYYDTLSVDGAGNLELPEYVGWGVVGLPYESELETLDLDTSDERTLTDAKKLVNRVGVAFAETKGGYIGQTGSSEDLSKMQRVIHRENEVLEESTKNINEHIDVSIPGEWEQTGRVLIKQVDPLPMSVLAVYPKGIAGD